MGLDINVYTNLKPYTGTLDKDGYPINDEDNTVNSGSFGNTNF